MLKECFAYADTCYDVTNGLGNRIDRGRRNMAAQGIAICRKVLPLEDSRAITRKSSVPPDESFEQQLIQEENRFSAEVIPLPLPSRSQHIESVQPVPSFPHKLVKDQPDCEIDEYLDRIESRIKDLECNILLLNRQVSALLRCL